MLKFRWLNPRPHAGRRPCGASRKVAVTGLLCTAVVATAGCGSSGSSPSSSAASSAPGSAPGSAASPAGASAARAGSGPVDVLYAGSLVNFMEKVAGPAFKKATGYSVTGYAGGSKALATDIKGKTYQADVFISAAPSVNASLEGTANGDWVSWYSTYATSPLVLGYNPGGKFASALKTRPWYDVITEPGFRVGFTDPALDPKGVLVEQALSAAAKSENLPALTAIGKDKANMFPEQDLAGRLQAGQLDAGFFYTSESVPANIPTVPLTGERLGATYTITVLNKAPHEAGAEALVSFLLGPAGQAELKSQGFSPVTPPTVTGTGVPAALKSVVS